MCIFLDIDGVLNKESDWKQKYTINAKNVAALGQLARKLRCTEVVLTSTWRVCNGENKPEFFINLENQLHSVGLSIVGMIPISKNHSRDEEIAYYLKRHVCGEYLILDDDISLFKNADNIPLYTVNYRTGFLESDVVKAHKLWKSYWR